jgi:hypothetical protein
VRNCACNMGVRKQSAREWSRAKYYGFLLVTRALQGIGLAMLLASALSVFLLVPLYKERYDVRAAEHEQAQRYHVAYCSDPNEVAYAGNGDVCFAKRLIMNRGEPWLVALYDLAESTRNSIVASYVHTIVAVVERLRSLIFVLALLIVGAGYAVLRFGTVQHARAADQRTSLPTTACDVACYGAVPYQPYRQHQQQPTVVELLSPTSPEYVETAKSK